MREIRADEISRDENSRIIKCAVNPRPIAWISTIDGNGTENLAPFSSYNYVSSSYPMVLFNSPRQATGRMKDTARNVLETGEFVVNVVTADLIEEMDLTSKRIPPEESEFKFAGLATGESRVIDPPVVAAAKVAMECRLYDTYEVHDKIMILGDVVYYHLSDDVLTDGRIDSRKMDNVARLGGPFYTDSEVLDFERQF